MACRNLVWVRAFTEYFNKFVESISAMAGGFPSISDTLRILRFVEWSGAQRDSFNYVIDLNGVDGFNVGRNVPPLQESTAW